MPDLMDAAQLHADELTEDALAAHARRPHPPGRTHCAQLDCREPIAAERTALGAQLCLDCQRIEEAQAAHLAAWRRR